MFTPSSPNSAIIPRRDKLLQREVQACEDPICCCEAEPRWLRLQHERDRLPYPSEWECLDRAPRDEL